MPLFRRITTHWTILFLLLGILFVFNIYLGSVEIPIRQIIFSLLGRPTQEPVWSHIIWNFRLTKALTCIIAGGALSISGLLMQTLFRNPLAGPDVLGLSSGASLAVSLLILSSLPAISVFNGPWLTALTACFGCATVFIVILFFAQKLKDPASLLIIGLMIGAGTSSIVSVLQFTSKAEELQTFLIWTFGNVGGMSWDEINVLFSLLIMGTIMALITMKSLNAWLLGENYAQSIGINIKRSRMLIIFSACILTGAVTAFCGPIAFVGLAVPHLVKLVIKTSNHKVLIPSVMVAGAILMLFCDILTRLPGDSHVLPLNAVTALFGAPVVIWVIMKNKVIRI